MTISIIIPVYKVERYIEDCLASVYNQTYRDLEVILVDDCTPDDSMKIARRFVKWKGPVEGIEVRFLKHAANKGLSAARNTGINSAKGDYIFFLDSDDEIPPECISCLAAPLSKKRYDFVIGEYRVIGSDRKIPSLRLEEGELAGNRRIFHEYCNRRFYMMAWGKLCNAGFLRNNGLLFQEGIVHEDELWSLRVSLAADSMYAVRKPVYIYKIRNDSITESESLKKRISNFKPVLGAFNQALDESRHRRTHDALIFLSSYYTSLYMPVIYNNWKEEYIALRKLDPRTFWYILRLCLSSWKQFRTCGHLLLPSGISYPLYTFLLRKILG